jgi:DNA repair protein RecO (recombination protein O)
MNNRSRAIVLHTTEYSTTSLIVKAYTEEYGAQSYIISGVRKKKSKFSMNLFQPLSLLEIISVNKKNSGLGRITEVSWSPPFTTIPFDMIRSSIAIFLSEVLYRSIKEEEKNPTLFQFLHNSIQILDAHHGDCSKFHLAFMIQLTKHLGIYPHGIYIENKTRFDLREGVFTDSIPQHDEYINCDASGILNKFLCNDLSQCMQISLSNTQKRELLASLILYYELHQTHGTHIRSHEILHEIMH